MWCAWHLCSVLKPKHRGPFLPRMSLQPFPEQHSSVAVARAARRQARSVCAPMFSVCMRIKQPLGTERGLRAALDDQEEHAVPRADELLVVQQAPLGRV